MRAAPAATSREMGAAPAASTRVGKSAAPADHVRTRARKSAGPADLLRVADAGGDQVRRAGADLIQGSRKIARQSCWMTGTSVT